MQLVPQIVRERLKAERPADSHPDANVLTAFAEKSLPENERAHVLAHLSQCGNCRDVLALSLPDTDTADAMKVPQRRPWMTWPAFRWGFVTAGVVMIGIGVMHYQRHIEPKSASMVAKQVADQETFVDRLQTSPPQSAPEASPSAKLGPSSAASPPNFLVKNEVRRDLQPNKSEVAGAKGAVKALDSGVRSSTPGGHVFGPRGPMQWQAQQQAQLQQSPARLGGLLPAPSPKTAEKDSIAGREAPRFEGRNVTIQVAAEAPKPANQPAGIPPASPPVAQFDRPEVLSVSKTKPAAVAKEDAGAGADGASSIPRWSIDSTGALQRSFDGGNSWQNVDVLANSATDLGYSGSLETVVTTTPAKQASADKKFAKKSLASPVFRAVAADANEVWAGGSSGVLYHSVDGGNRWTRVIPSFQGSSLSGDIVGLQLSDALHVSISTSIPEIWTTADGGHTWQRQQ